jgi:hypothetical protein
MTAHRILGRYLAPAAAVAGAALALRAYLRAAPSYPHAAYLTGWALFALILFLTAYNARKKIPFLPLLSSRLWLRAHSWVGMAAALVFMAHLGWRKPAGPLGAALAVLFVAVTLSGIAGWWLSRVLPRRLTSAGGEVPYDRIPAIRRALRQRAESLVITGIPTAGATTLADFYASRLSSFFEGPANFGQHLFGSRHALNSMLSELGEVKKYLNHAEKSAAIELAALVREKDALDLHRSMQLVLKGWLFVHIPLTYGMLAFIGVHVVLVYAFAGGAR